ncbi:Phosphatidylcholine:ceramide cholinephosphotransferase 1 [Pseudolycoriella hygida]|uniref:Phosphatidylcholine:ceramide cholinephosphotransferase 1 n=1 Tax=Pseudolycoriella hygida TaxID=35572 RepID=A0A9Q0NBA1_9DIPT|nr:Phosphatidylcholine:ceramide cholinephosphotransferase 1 [Pseudolycoriella hygida]
MPPANFSNPGYEKDTSLDEFEGKHTYFSSTDIRKGANVHAGANIELIQEFPQEKRKTLIAIFATICTIVINDISNVLTHQKVPDRNLHPPLPDITLDNVTKIRWLNDVADILATLSLITILSTIVLHRHGWIVCRRIFLILALLYCLRSVTMYVTVLPLANNHDICSPKMNDSLTAGQKFISIMGEVVQLLGSAGMRITGKRKMCGDYIFSGHTIILMMGNLVVCEYIPKRCHFIQWTTSIIAWVGMICLVVSHGHYTIDVLVGYFITTRLFWIYHTMCYNSELKTKSSMNPLSNVWWFSGFRYFESNVSGKLPEEYRVSSLRTAIQEFVASFTR